MNSTTAIDALILSARDEKLNIRLPAQLKKQLQREADARKLKLSDYVLQLLIQRAK